MKHKSMDRVASFAQERWGREKAQKIKEDSVLRWKELCKENQNAGRKKKVHLENQIFPCVSYYEALQKNGISSEEALDFLDESWSRQARKNADSLKKLLKVFGLYRLYPAMFRWTARHQFGTDAGFSAEFYQCGSHCCRFHMTKCLFKDVFTQYGYPELTVCFCHTDDINNENLHPRLCWNRTRFMGKGDPFCEFEISVKK